jgi:hypothetical protein
LKRLSWVVAVLVGVVLLAACGQDVPPHGLRASEAVWCADEAGAVDTVNYQGHDGPLTAIAARVIELPGEVTVDELVDACLPRFRRSSSATVCEAYATADDVIALVDRIHTTAVHGDLTGERRGFPVVLRGDVVCEEVTLDLGIGVDQLRAWDGAATAAFNRAREVEGRLARAADEGCLSVDEARNLALDVRDDLRGDWPVVESVPGAEDEEHTGGCFDVRLARHGVIQVEWHYEISREPPRAMQLRCGFCLR